MIALKLNKDQIERARNLYPFDELRGSITKGESNIYGSVGEVMVWDFLESKTDNIEFKSTYDYDMLLNGKRLDIKTKKTTVVPQPHYLCSISVFNTRQQCDYYVFTRVNESLDTGYILGVISKQQFFDNAFFKREGDVDVNGWKFKGDCYNMKIGDIRKFARGGNHL